MKPVTISSKYPVVIPRSMREQFNLKPGQKIMFVPHNDTLRVVSVPPIEDAQGLFPGIDTAVLRDKED
jgi:AbrB family looped-hinge helix DNA binding protein